MVPAVIVPAVGPPAPPVLGVDDLLAEFLESLSANTRAAYDWDLRDYAKRMGFDGPKLALATLLAWGPGSANEFVLRYRTLLTNGGLANATIARRLSAIRSFVRLARVLGTIIWSIEIQSPKVQSYRDTAGPGREGWHKVRQTAARRTDTKGVRDLAILRLLHDLAGRRNEIVTLDLEHVERHASFIVEGVETWNPVAIWIKGKGVADRIRLDLPPSTSTALEDWIRLRGPSPGPLFPRLDRPGAVGRLTGRSVARMVGQLGADAGLPRDLHPHALRHQAITHALDKTNGNVRMVQRFSRHVKVQTLLDYDDRRTDPSSDIARLVADDDS